MDDANHVAMRERIASPDSGNGPLSEPGHATHLETLTEQGVPGIGPYAVAQFTGSGHLIREPEQRPTVFQVAREKQAFAGRTLKLA